MKRLYDEARKVEDYGGTESPSFKSFARKFKNSFNKELEKVGGTIVDFNRGHYYVSGFFNVDSKLFYFSVSDIRYSNFGEMLYRTAKNTKDYTGGMNQYVTIEDDMVLGMKIF